MRSFPLMFLLIFLGFYLLITIGSIVSLSKIVSKKKRTQTRNIIIGYSLFILLSFVYLFVWPQNARSTENYKWYLIYNVILSIDFIFKIPLAFSFILGLVLFRIKNTVSYFIAFIISICLGTSVLFGSLFGKNEIVINRIELEFANLPKNFNGYKIVQFSDTHLGSFLHSKKLMNKAVKSINELNPSLILFTGDLVNNFASEVNGWSETFQKINQKQNSFAILGNHDYGNYSNWTDETAKTANFDRIVDSHRELGLTLLRNENAVIKEGTDSIYIIGVENWGHPPFPQYADLDKAMKNVPENTFQILLTHDPAHWDSVVKERQDIELSLAGHTHGLQWGIKKAGINFSFSYFIRKNWGGLYSYGNSKLYVNTGLGMVGIPWRINMPGEITLITLKRVEIN